MCRSDRASTGTPAALALAAEAPVPHSFAPLSLRTKLRSTTRGPRAALCKSTRVSDWRSELEESACAMRDWRRSSRVAGSFPWATGGRRGTCAVPCGLPTRWFRGRARLVGRGLGVARGRGGRTRRWRRRSRSAGGRRGDGVSARCRSRARPCWRAARRAVCDRLAAGGLAVRPLLSHRRPPGAGACTWVLAHWLPPSLAGLCERAAGLR
jgi:hypothetical protein